MNTKGVYLTTLVLLYFILNLNCRESTGVTSIFKFIQPEYTDIQLRPENDSLHFQLKDDTYNQIKSFNYFEYKDKPYISFYDRRSESINIYDFLTQHQIKKIKIKDCLSNRTLYKTSVFVKSFDSIFITNLWKLYVIDTTGKIKKRIEFFRKTEAMAFYENSLPVIAKNNLLFMGVRPYVNENSFAKLKQWKLLYGFNLSKNSKKLYYNLPDIYYSNLYDDRFFAYSYCYNENGRFVFSFPVDSNIYETDLEDYHYMYYGKSKFQHHPIKALSKDALENDGGFKEYMLRDIYGPIYYDPYNKRYLRIAKQKITLKSFNEKKYNRKQSVIFFNKDFQIIGESELQNDLNTSSLIVTPNGEIYARINAKDEYALHFIRLAYNDVVKSNNTTIAKMGK